MASRHNINTNRWWPWVVGTAERRRDYSQDEMELRIVQLMETAYAIGKKEGKEEHERTSRKNSAVATSLA